MLVLVWMICYTGYYGTDLEIKYWRKSLTKHTQYFLHITTNIPAQLSHLS